VPGLALRVLLPFGVAYFTSYWLRTINAVIAPDLVRDLKLTASELGFLSAAYFATFAAFQIPLGMLLDRFGPRRVNAVLVTCAAAGALWFSLAAGIQGLTLARALIGFGVSAGLMASVKAATIWFPPERLAAVNGRVLVIGALGALAATTPTQALLHYVTWRQLFWGASALALTAVVLLIRVVPPDTHATRRETFTQQWSGLAQVFSRRAFWHISAVSMLSQGTYIGLQSLWAGPWLIDVARLTRESAANHLLTMSLAMIAGAFFFGYVGSRFARAGRLPSAPMFLGIALFCCVQLALALGWHQRPLLAWVLFGFFGTAGTLAFAVVPRHFAATLTGRAITALNLLVFGCAFACQWGVGAIIHQWPESNGHYHPLGYRAGFAACLGLQVLALSWSMWDRRKGEHNEQM
jgi:predicted MFS family arabinose efflux permease